MVIRLLFPALGCGGRGVWFGAVLGIGLLAGLGGCRSQESGPEDGKMSVAFVYVGPVGDGGWTYAHDEGRKYLEEKDPNITTQYVESVKEGADAEQAIRSLARQGFKLIITTSFGFMDPTAAVADEFPQQRFLHISGFRNNGRNMASLMGAMETMRYMAGMIAGARAKADAATLIGAVEPFPIAEVVRLLNAFALGMRRTCPECTIQVRWTHNWYDPVKEKEAAESLLAAGAAVIVTGCDTTGPVVAAAQAGKWAIGYDSKNACREAPERCLTTTYWNWGPTYLKFAKAAADGTFQAVDHYLDADSGLVGLLGFEPGETPNSGIPAGVLEEVRQIHAQAKAGTFGRFDVFKGPIRDNRGQLVVGEGKSLSQEDLEGLKQVPGRPDCTACVHQWLAEGIEGHLSESGE